jgi:hypothetical protein
MESTIDSNEDDAIPDYIKANRNGNKFPRIKVLEYFIKCSYSTPGTDSSRNLRFKKIDCCGTYGTSLDIIMRSLVNFYLISSFEQDAKIIANGIVTLVNNYVKDNQDIVNSLILWCKSPAGSEEFFKYIRDKRSEILKTWMQMLTLKPYTILFTSLSKFTSLWKKNSSLFQSSSQEIQVSIFGMTG